MSVPGQGRALAYLISRGRSPVCFPELARRRSPSCRRSLTRTYSPGEPALGKGIRPGGLAMLAGDGWFRVVGVVEDVHETTLHDDPPAMAFYPMAFTVADDEQFYVPRFMRYVVRGPNPTALTAGLRDVVRDLDPGLPISDISTLDALVARARAPQAVVMVLMLVAAGGAPPWSPRRRREIADRRSPRPTSSGRCCSRRVRSSRRVFATVAALLAATCPARELAADATGNANSVAARRIAGPRRARLCAAGDRRRVARPAPGP